MVSWGDATPRRRKGARLGFRGPQRAPRFCNLRGGVSSAKRQRTETPPGRGWRRPAARMRMRIPMRRPRLEASCVVLTRAAAAAKPQQRPPCPRAGTWEISHSKRSMDQPPSPATPLSSPSRRISPKRPALAPPTIPVINPQLHLRRTKPPLPRRSPPMPQTTSTSPRQRITNPRSTSIKEKSHLLGLPLLPTTSTASSPHHHQQQQQQQQQLQQQHRHRQQHRHCHQLELRHRLELRLRVGSCYRLFPRVRCLRFSRCWSRSRRRLV
jgi:hypothetical protein